MGRSCIDLYSKDVGAPFIDVTSFAAYVGGCPTNISVGTKRLGLNSALLTAVGNDLTGDFVLNFLNKEGVDTRFIPRKPGRRTSARPSRRAWSRSRMRTASQPDAAASSRCGVTSPRSAATVSENTSPESR